MTKGCRGSFHQRWLYIGREGKGQRPLSTPPEKARMKMKAVIEIATSKKLSDGKRARFKEIIDIAAEQIMEDLSLDEGININFIVSFEGDGKNDKTE